MVVRSLRKARISVTELRSDNPLHGMSEPPPRSDAFVVALQVRGYGPHEHWEDGRQIAVSDYHGGDTTIYDLWRDPTFMINAPFHSVHFCLPLAAMNEIADEVGAAHVDDLRYTPGGSVDDSTIRNVGSSLLAAFEHPDRVSRVFVDHVTMAVAAHVAQTYGGMTPRQRAPRGGLAPRTERRAKEIIEANLDGSVGLREIAEECGLSVSHFTRAFRQSTGLTPHVWLLQRRVQVAKDLLRGDRLSLPDIALACGFADQSHFTRVFTRHVSMSPGVWRRHVLE